MTQPEQSRHEALLALRNLIIQIQADTPIEELTPLVYVVVDALAEHATWAAKKEIMDQVTPGPGNGQNYQVTNADIDHGA